MAGPGRLSNLAESVRRRSRPLPQGPRVVALSGGADSAVCGWLAGDDRSQPARAVFVDHGFPESPTMAEAARRVAERLELRLTEVAVRVEEGSSPEGRARASRHRALADSLEPGEWLLLAHTADDQAETVLANLLRGAGAEGLAGIPPRRGRLVRPLLGVSRSETRELATLLGLPWREDPTNLRLDARRNLIRRQLLPSLEATFNPALREVLCRTAGVLASDQEFLEAASSWVSVTERVGEVALPAPVLTTLPPPVAARVVRRALRRLRGPHAGSAAEVAAVVQVAAGEREGATLSGSVSTEREGPWVVLTVPGDETSPEPVALSFPGSADFGLWRLESRVEASPPLAWPLSRWVTVLDAEAAGKRAIVRAGSAGGKISLADGAKSVGDALAEAGVPARRRSTWPVLEMAGEVLWVPGARSAAWAWVAPHTSRYLWVSAAPGRGVRRAMAAPPNRRR